MNISIWDGFIHPPYPPSRRSPRRWRDRLSAHYSENTNFQAPSLQASFSATDFHRFRTTFSAPSWGLSTLNIATMHFPSSRKKKYKNHCFSKVLATLASIFLPFRTREFLVKYNRIGPRGPFSSVKHSIFFKFIKKMRKFNFFR